MEKTSFTMEEMVSYCNQYGFIYQGSEIYGGLANTWDYGPLGTRLKNQIKDAWRYYFIQQRENSYELDADILMNPRVWEASGHRAGFTDPLLDCKECKTRHRADKLIQGTVLSFFAEGLILHLFELNRAEGKILGRDLIAKCLSDLSDTKR